MPDRSRTSGERSVSGAALAMHVLGAAVMLVDTVVIEASVLVGVIAIVLVGLHLSSVAALEPRAAAFVSALPLLFAISFFVYLWTGAWDCYPACSSGDKAVGWAAAVLGALFALVILAGSVIRVRRAYSRRRSAGHRKA